MSIPSTNSARTFAPVRLPVLRITSTAPELRETILAHGQDGIDRGIEGHFPTPNSRSAPGLEDPVDVHQVAPVDPDEARVREDLFELRQASHVPQHAAGA